MRIVETGDQFESYNSPMFDRLRANWLVLGCVALVLLTALAGVLQYHWINRVSDAERRQRHDLLAGTLRSFSVDFRETVLRQLPFIRPFTGDKHDVVFETSLLDLTSRWRSTAEHPQLLKSISIGTESEKGSVFKRLRPGDAEFREETWPDEFSLYRGIVEKRSGFAGGQPPFFPRGFVFELIQGRPVLIFPLISGAPSAVAEQAEGRGPRQFPLPPRDEGMLESPPQEQPPGPPGLLPLHGPGSAEAKSPRPEFQGWCFLEVDADFLRERLLPELVARHYGAEARSDYKIAVVATRPLAIVYGSAPTVTIDSLSEVDAGVVLLEANMPQGRAGPPTYGPRAADGPPPRERRPGPPPPPPPGPQPFVSEAEGMPLQRLGTNRAGGSEDNAWVLVVKSKSGSLEALVEQSRRRNLALSFGILLLLAGSTVMLMLANARARSLARQQMEFVAGVSHELRTPLTVIQSTSYNLSQGMIHDPGRVRQYGEVIQGEARRLINQVERMLSFAGIQSGRRTYDPQPTNVGEIIERALAEYAGTFASDGWQVEKHIEDHLPRVLTDAPALESSLKNLFENALKYALPGKWLSVNVRATQNKRTPQVQITVADHGPGIPAKELSHIFEPFYRGQAVIASAIGGTGLGLSLVERQMRALGGSVTVQSLPGSGTSFTLHLPALTEEDVSGVDKRNGHERQNPAG